MTSSASLWLFLLRRVAIMLPILFGVVTFTFFVTRVIPGDPAHFIVGASGDAASIRAIQEQIGTDKPLVDQYTAFLGDAVRLDFGESVFTTRPVMDDLLDRLPATLELIVLGLALGLLIGLPAGAYAARRRGRAADRGVRVWSFVLLSIPEFWLGMILLYIFFFRLGIAPSATGQLDPSDPRPTRITGAMFLDSLITGNWAALGPAAAHLVLPVITLGTTISAPLARLSRSAVREVLGSDYILFGRSAGLPGAVLWRYSIRAALPPVITYVGIVFSALIGGAVLVESVFSWGGAAQYAYNAIGLRDYAAIQAFVLVAGVISVGTFLVIDLLHLAIDPRIRLTGGGFRLDRLRALFTVRAVLTLPGALRARASALAGLWPGLPRARPGVGALLPRPQLGGSAALLRAAATWSASRLNGQIVAGALILAVMVAGAYIVPAVSAYDPREGDLEASLLSPSLAHPFGTDENGFDMFVRVFYAPRIDFAIASLGVLLSLVLGLLLGLLAGYSRGLLGEIVMRVADLLQAFPVLILAIALVTLAGNNRANLIWALAFINTPIFVRLLRSRVLTVRELRFIESSVALGNPPWRMLVRHVLPNSIGPVIVQLGVAMGYAILILAGLAFLGVGIQVPTPEWGSMILSGRQNLTTGQWWTIVFPGLFLALAVFAFNLLSEGVERARELGQH